MKLLSSLIQAGVLALFTLDDRNISIRKSHIHHIQDGSFKWRNLLGGSNRDLNLNVTTMMPWVLLNILTPRNVGHNDCYAPSRPQE